MTVTGYGLTDGYLKEDEVRAVIIQALDTLPVDDRRLLVIVPDATRTFPMNLFFRQIARCLLPRVRALNFVVALGTHAPLSEEAMLQLFGITAEERAGDYGKVGFFNHAWDDPNALVSLGTISEAEASQISRGMVNEPIPVRINRLALEHDHLLVCGPVFPHEVVGFSGGNKYFFPGISGADIINITHWLGARLTCYATIGVKDTLVRKVIDRAATLIPRPRHALCSVVEHDGVAGLFFGLPEEAWSAAADLSAVRHIVWCDHPFKQVISVLPEMYNELWVGGKGMYKMEPVVAEGGELIIYAPHLKEISVVHGEWIRKVGYHVLEYFTKQMGKFSDVPRSILAHSSHVRGNGSFENGVEKPRIQVTLATGIPEEVCRQINLGYRDPASLDLKALSGREDEGILVVPRAGEYLHRLKSERGK
jgi:lactate racemase